MRRNVAESIRTDAQQCLRNVMFFEYTEFHRYADLVNIALRHVYQFLAIARYDISYYWMPNSFVRIVYRFYFDSVCLVDLPLRFSSAHPLFRTSRKPRILNQRNTWLPEATKQRPLAHSVIGRGAHVIPRLAKSPRT